MPLDVPQPPLIPSSTQPTRQGHWQGYPDWPAEEELPLRGSRLQSCNTSDTDLTKSIDQATAVAALDRAQSTPHSVASPRRRKSARLATSTMSIPTSGDRLRQDTPPVLSKGKSPQFLRQSHKTVSLCDEIGGPVGVMPPDPPLLHCWTDSINGLPRHMSSGRFTSMEKGMRSSSNQSFQRSGAPSLASIDVKRKNLSHQRRFQSPDLATIKTYLHISSSLESCFVDTSSERGSLDDLSISGDTQGTPGDIDIYHAECAETGHRVEDEGCFCCSGPNSAGSHAADKSRPPSPFVKTPFLETPRTFLNAEIPNMPRMSKSGWCPEFVPVREPVNRPYPHIILRPPKPIRAMQCDRV